MFIGLGSRVAVALRIALGLGAGISRAAASRRLLRGTTLLLLLLLLLLGSSSWHTRDLTVAPGRRHTVDTTVPAAGAAPKRPKLNWG